MKERTIRIKDGEGWQGQERKLHFIAEMHTDAGICRKINQDACCVRIMEIGGHSLALAAVCDGVGGMQEGDFASRSTIQLLNNWFDYTVSRNLPGKNGEEIMAYLKTEIEDCIQKQNRLVYGYAKEKGIRTGTTLTLLIIADREYMTAQVGDSRAYRIGSRLRQLTEDQSVVAQEIKAGRLSAEEAKHDSRRNMILQCVGGAERLHIAYSAGRVRDDDIFFLCSDGFVHELSDREIEERMQPVLSEDRASIKQILMDTVSLIKARGEKDNITVVLVKVQER